MRKKREKYVERESQRAKRSNVERDKILLERLDHLRENQRKVEKVKRKKEEERNVEDLRAKGVRGCTCEEFFFCFEIELMSDVW